MRWLKKAGMLHLYDATPKSKVTMKDIVFLRSQDRKAGILLAENVTCFIDRVFTACT